MTSPRPELGLSFAAPRRGRIVASFLVGTALLVGATAWLTTHLTTRALEDRVRLELMHTAGLLGGVGFPLTDPALERIAEYIAAEVVVVDAAGRPLASSLSAAEQEAFARAQATSLLPAVPRAPEVVQRTVGERRVTLGVAPLPFTSVGPRGAVYVLYPEDLVTAQARRAWLPVTGVSVVALLLAAALGVAAERRVQRAQSAALLRLLASVAHEVRNPLGAIRTLARSLKPRLAGVDPKPLDLIAAEADRLALLVEGLRAVGLPVRTVRRAIEPDAAVADVVTLVEHQLRHRRVAVEERLGAPGAQVSADPAQVRQVVLNLLLNAADAQPRGGVVRLVSRAVPADEAHGASWELAVEDDGPGVPLEVRARLFDPFFTTKPDGVGVGLTLSRRLAEAHGASLALDQDVARGARFVLRWPLLVSAPAASPAAPARAPAP